MFEFHGWLSLHYHTHDCNQDLQDACVEEIQRHLTSCGSDRVRIDRYNGVDTLMAFGQHNHRNEAIISLFKWAAEKAPGSYGLLHILDDEDVSRGGKYDNCMRVWVFKRGHWKEVDDPFLSPCIPEIEDEYDESRND